MRAPSVFVPPRSTPMTRCSPTRGGYDTSLVGEGDKPYRVYRGGRAQGTVPLASKQASAPVRKKAPASGANGSTPYRGPGPKRARKKRSWGRRIALGVLVLILLFVAWA